MNLEVTDRGKWISIELPELLDILDTRFVDWAKYNQYVIDNVKDTVVNYGVADNDTPYAITLAKDPELPYSPERFHTKAILEKLASNPPYNNAGAVFDTIIKSDVPLEGRVYIFISSESAPVYRFYTQYGQNFIVKPFVENEKGASVMNGILVALGKITSSANLDLKIKGRGKHYYLLDVLEDGGVVNRLELSHGQQTFSPKLGRDEGKVYLTAIPLEEKHNHRSVELFDQLVRLLNGYDYVTDIKEYEYE